MLSIINLIMGYGIYVFGLVIVSLLLVNRFRKKQRSDELARTLSCKALSLTTRVFILAFFVWYFYSIFTNNISEILNIVAYILSAYLLLYLGFYYYLKWRGLNEE